ncbi:MAG: isoprenylcysteine carboxylmethyltransferase family protein [Ignavibacteriaceae bacterium]
MSEVAKRLFKYRSYTPLPFLVLMIIFAKPFVLSLIFGFVIAIIGELIRFWGVSWAGSETRTTSGVGGSNLIISGPFAYVRNPLYVGNMMLYLGVGIMSWALFPYLQAAAFIFFAIQYYSIVSEEENFLKTEFGEDYKKYCENVPRFFPRIIPYKNPGIEQPEFNSKKGFRSERRTLQAFASIFLIVIIIWILQNS